MTRAGIENYDGAVFLDDDCILSPEYFDILLKRAFEYDIVSGPNLNPAEESPYSFQSKVSLFLASKWVVGPFWSRFRKGISGRRSTNCSFMLCNLYVSKKVLKCLRFSDQMFSGEENDFLCRARKQGFTTFYDGQLQVEHLRRSNLKHLILQNSKYGLGRAEQIFSQNPAIYSALLFTGWAFLLIGLIHFYKITAFFLSFYLVATIPYTLVVLRKSKLNLQDLLIIPSIQLGYLWGLVTSPFYILRYAFSGDTICPPQTENSA